MRDDTSGQEKVRPAREGSFPPGLVLYLRLLVVLTALPFLYLLELYFAGGSPLLARLWSPEADRFGDFWHYQGLFQWLHRPEFFLSRDRFAYPAPCAILYQVLFKLGRNPHASYNVMLFGVEAISAVLLARALVRRGMEAWKAVALTAFMAVSSYPWHMLYDRANIELFLYVLIGGGVWAWLEGHEDLAAVLWGCAGAMKIYPALLLAMFAKKGQWQRFALGAATCVGVLLFSFWYVGPTVKLAASGTMRGVRGFVGTYGAHSRFGELVFDHSILGAVKAVLALPLFPPNDKQVTLSHVYEAVVALLGPVFFLRWRRHAPERNQLCLLLVGIMTLPPVSYDYTLTYSYLVAGIVMCDYWTASAEGEPYPGWKSYFVAFALLATAENWINVLGLQVNGVLKAGSLLMVAALVIRHPLHEGLRRPVRVKGARPIQGVLQEA